MNKTHISLFALTPACQSGSRLRARAPRRAPRATVASARWRARRDPDVRRVCKQVRSEKIANCARYVTSMGFNIFQQVNRCILQRSRLMMGLFKALLSLSPKGQVPHSALPCLPHRAPTTSLPTAPPHWHGTPSLRSQHARTLAARWRRAQDAEGAKSPCECSEEPRRRARFQDRETPPVVIRFFGNNFRSALFTCRRLRISLCLIHTKPPPAGFGVGIAWSDANPHPRPLPLGR